MEIDDNLAGAEMNALDTAVFLAERKAVYERLHPETKAGVAGGLARQGSASDIVSFATSTAEKFGVSKRHVERMVSAGSRLGAADVAQLRLSKRPVSLKDLIELSKIGEAEERSAVVLRLASGNAKSAADARRSLRVERDGAPETEPVDPVETQLAALMSAWERAGAAARRRFIDAQGMAILEMRGLDFGFDMATEDGK